METILMFKHIAMHMLYLYIKVIYTYKNGLSHVDKIHTIKQ